MRSAPEGAADGAAVDARRVVLVAGGPVLVEGPVDIEADGEPPQRVDRFLVALCACRRSKRYPLCDTSHRRTT